MPTSDNKPGNGRQTSGQPYTPPVVSPRSSVETNPQPAFAKYPGAVDLATEMRKSGFGNNYSSSFDYLDFVIYGISTLKKDLEEAKEELGRTQFNREAKQAEVDAVKRKIDAKRAEIRQKVFFLGSEKYSVSEVEDNGDDSRFTMTFIPPTPMGIIFTIPEGIAKEVVLPIQGVQVDKMVAAPPIITWGSRISLRVIGSADSLNELVSNKENYRVYMWFNNFRFGDAESYSANADNLNPLTGPSDCSGTLIFMSAKVRTFMFVATFSFVGTGGIASNEVCSIFSSRLSGIFSGSFDIFVPSTFSKKMD